MCRSQWPRGLRCGSAVPRLLGLSVRIPPETLKPFVRVVYYQVENCVGLIILPGESYRVWCVWVWSWSLNNEKILAVVPRKDGTNDEWWIGEDLEGIGRDIPTQINNSRRLSKLEPGRHTPWKQTWRFSATVRQYSRSFLMLEPHQGLIRWLTNTIRLDTLLLCDLTATIRSQGSANLAGRRHRTTDLIQPRDPLLCPPYLMAS
jgi:hypothetical protein